MNTAAATRKPTATEAYLAHHEATLALLARITEHLTNHDDATAEGLHWGHVGDAAETRKTLQELSDRLFNEGEYAWAGCLSCGGAIPTADFTAHSRSCRR